MGKKLKTKPAPTEIKAGTSGETKRHSAEQVVRSDTSRSHAEASTGKRGPGRPRKDGSPAQPRSVAEISANVKTRAVKEKAAQETEDTWREPSKADVRRCVLMIRQGNKPLVQLEKQLLAVPIQPPLIEAGELVMSEDELEFGADCTAGSLAAISPNIARYLPVVGLVFWGLSIIVSRGLVMWRVKQREPEIKNLMAQYQAMLEAQGQAGQSPADGQAKLMKIAP